MAKKIEATELVEVRVDFVSFVDEGASGQEFQIFKSAGEPETKEKETETERIEMKAEEANLFRKFVGFFKQFVKVNKEEDEMDLDKILDAIKGVGETVKGMDARLTAIEEKVKKEGEVDEETTTEKPEETAGADEGADTSTTKDDTSDDNASDTGTDDNPDGADKAGDGTPSLEKESKIEEALKSLGESMTGLSKRMEKIEKTRVPSTGIDGDVTKGSKAESLFKGVF